MRQVLSWNDYLLGLLEPIAARSKDPNTQVGCVIVGPNKEIKSTGYNSLPFGIKDREERFERPEKYKWIEHAERNAIYLAARQVLNGCSLYASGIPCIDCARGIIQSGIKTVYVDKAKQEKWNTPKYAQDFEFVEDMFKEAGVELCKI